MTRLFDLLAIMSGLLGLTAMVWHGTPLTPENASMQATRAIIVLTFVVVPFCIARAYEKVNVAAPLTRLRNRQKARRHTQVQQIPAAPDTLFFDYFFQPGSAQDWEAGERVEVRPKGTRGKNLFGRRQHQ